MAPERFTTGQSDTRSDIYALTCVLYECLTSSRPFPGNSVEQQIAGHLTTPPPRPSIKSAGSLTRAGRGDRLRYGQGPRKSGTPPRPRWPARPGGDRHTFVPAGQPGSRQTAPGAAPSAPTQAFHDEDTEKTWHKETQALPAEKAEPESEKRPSVDATQARPARTSTAAVGGNQSRHARARRKGLGADAGPTGPPRPQPPWAPTHAGTPGTSTRRGTDTSRCARDVCRERRRSHTGPAGQAPSRRVSHPMLTAPQQSRLDAPWPWYRRTAIVVPMAIVMIVAAVATILLVLSGGEESSPVAAAPAPPPGAGLERQFTAIRRPDPAQWPAVPECTGRR